MPTRDAPTGEGDGFPHSRENGGGGEWRDYSLVFRIAGGWNGGVGSRLRGNTEGEALQRRLVEIRANSVVDILMGVERANE